MWTVLAALALAQDTSPIDPSEPAQEEDLIVERVPEGVLFTNVRVVDALGERVVDGLYVDGEGIIQSVSGLPEGASPATTMDLAGKTVTPGLIDCHVHLSMTPSGAHHDLSREEDLALWAHHLRAYLASGVTTVLDTGVLLEDAKELRRLEAEGPSPTIHFLGPLLSPPDGYVSVVLPAFQPVRTATDVRLQVEAFTPLEPVGIKITAEDGMVFRNTWPLYPEEVVAALKDPVATAGRPLMVHAMHPAEYKYAFQFSPKAFVHPPQNTPKWLVEELVDTHTPVISTLSVFDSLLNGPEPERMAHPMYTERVPKIELEAAKNADWLGESNRTVADHVMPKTPGFVRATAAGMFGKSGPLQKRTDRMQKMVGTLHAAGVPIVMGSDSGNWPVFPFEFHGPTSIREVELLVGSGLTEQEAIVASTLAGAELIGIADQVGTIEVGKRADLVVLPADPLTDISVFRSPDMVMVGGELRTSAQWLSP